MFLQCSTAFRNFRFLHTHTQTHHIYMHPHHIRFGLYNISFFLHRNVHVCSSFNAFWRESLFRMWFFYFYAHMFFFQGILTISMLSFFSRISLFALLFLHLLVCTCASISTQYPFHNWECFRWFAFCFLSSSFGRMDVFELIQTAIAGKHLECSRGVQLW